MPRLNRPGYPALGEALVIAPGGMSLNGPAAWINEALFESVFLMGSPTLGDAVIDALATTAGPEMPPFMMRIYNILGDPALMIN